MEDEVLVSGAVVFRTRGEKVSWLIIKPGNDDVWQLPKSVVRRGESSVRTAIRVLAEMAGLRVRVIEEAGRTTITSRRKGGSLSKKLIYYLVLQKGKDDANKNGTKISWVDFTRARDKLASSEKRILIQAKQALIEWQKQTNFSH